ncbi:uncharacterized protein LOC112574900 [Pomacea canaliculata]|uniref:uncharacterized protein LOC112574900 n=1 Tax=Pomacea canaliculata TaxID=400727 RepID=UPI000D7278DB|nr:uncharacterized protein LOC112574900 [Pomacea canaliculata]
MSNATSKTRQGDFDVLLIHRNYGFVVCEVKSFGDNARELNMSQQTLVNSIRKRLKEAISQLHKAETILSHLVSDIAPGLRITKTIVVPNITADQIQEVIATDCELAQDLCRCLGTTTDPADITGLCLCCDQLSDPKTPWDVSSHVLSEFGLWWQRRVAGAGPEKEMTLDLYKILVARFCGPATTVTVPCTSPPRVSVKTMDQAVWCTGECYTALITLFPEQVDLLNMAHPRLFMTGPPGTGKTVVLLLMAIEWLRWGHHVYVVSTWWRSRAACSMLHQLLQRIMNMHETPGKPHLLQYHFEDEKDVTRAVAELSQKAIGGKVYVIADEVVRGHMSATRLQTFCDDLLKQVPRLHLWAANCYDGHVPVGWPEEKLTRPLRSPPAVVREIKKSREITAENNVSKYSERGVPDHTDGPPVRRLYHQGAHHSSSWLGDCVTCGREVASFYKVFVLAMRETAHRLLAPTAPVQLHPVFSGERFWCYAGKLLVTTRVCWRDWRERVSLSG